MDPFTAFSASINTLFTFTNFVGRVNEVGLENEGFLRTIQVVRNDLIEIERLWNTKPIQQKLISTPSKLEWIKSAIYNANASLNDIGKWVDRSRVDQQELGKVEFENHVRWAFQNQGKLVNQQTKLAACHQQLSNVLGYLAPLEVAVSTEPPTYYATTYFDDIRFPHQRPASNPIRTMSGESILKYDTEHASLTPAAPPKVNTSPFPRVQFGSEIEIPIAGIASTGVNLPPPLYSTYADGASHNINISGPDRTGTITTSYQKNIPPASHSKNLEKFLPWETQIDYSNECETRSVPSHARSLAIRGTNIHGPVDPHELCQYPTQRTFNSIEETTSVESEASVQPGWSDDKRQFWSKPPPKLPYQPPSYTSSKPPSGHPSRFSNMFPYELSSEIPSELPAVVPVELPTNDIGPPPGYPRLIARKAVPNSPVYSGQIHVHPHEQTRAESGSKTMSFNMASLRQELPTVPVTSRPDITYEMPAVDSYYSAVPPPLSRPIRPVSTALPPKPTTLSPMELAPQSRPRYRTSSSVSPLSSPWSTSATPLWTGPSPISSPPSASPNLSSHRWQTSRLRPTMKPQTLSSNRMQNQKSYMDLLGSLDKK